MNISIKYCTSWGYYSQALRLREELQNKFNADVEIIEGSGGVFEVSMYNEYKDERHEIFSKKELGRFPNDKEVIDLIEEVI